MYVQLKLFKYNIIVIISVYKYMNNDIQLQKKTEAITIKTHKIT